MGSKIRDGGTDAGDRVMKVAVTGARGFVGRHVLAELATRQVEVVATTTPAHAEHVPPGAALVRWLALDIRHPPANCLEALGNPDVLIHLAWAGLPNYRSLHHFETELPTQYRFISGLVRQGLPSLVTTGTCFEYGFQSGPLRADIETRPNNPYGFAKDALRKQLQYLKAVHPYSLTWARLFYMHGEGQPETSLLPMLKKAAAAGQPVFDMSQGEQLRDYLPVTVVARRLVDLALSADDTGVINVCSGSPISVRRLVENWIEQNGWNIELNLGHFAYPDYEPMAFWGVDGDDGSAGQGR
jgi:nucleoside-diphosphate-sugar epimerase